MAVNRRKRWGSKHFPISSHREKPAKPEKQTIADMVTAWLFAHRPVFLFLLIFGVLMALFYLFTAFTPFYHNMFIPWYHHYIAYSSGTVLNFIGQHTTVTETIVYSPRFSFEIIRGCDAVEATTLFICGVLAFPAPFLRKVPGIIAGTLFLAFLNLIRIISLFLIGVYFPEFFAIMHISAWQAMFIFLTVILWILWLLWATQNQISPQSTSG
jgi:exosortase/archaeosortase family protein